MWNSLPEKIRQGDSRALTRAISLVENEVSGYETFLQQLNYDPALKVTGITGPPGAGKSTLVDGLIGEYTSRGERVCIICVDPSSAFTGGALLGDRVRMLRWHNHPDVFIRSLSARGTLGGLNAGIVEVIDVVRTFPCDRIIVETVGVGQSEIEIASLADTTVVVQVPEGGDDIQTMKAGLMEIADIFVVNKCDRPGADTYIKNLNLMLQHDHKETAVIKTNASTGLGIKELANLITSTQTSRSSVDPTEVLLKRAMQLILKSKMKGIDQHKLKQLLNEQHTDAGFNLYRFVSTFN